MCKGPLLDLNRTKYIVSKQDTENDNQTIRLDTSLQVNQMRIQICDLIDLLLMCLCTFHVRAY